MLNVKRKSIERLMATFDRGETAFFEEFGGGPSKQYDLLGVGLHSDKRYPPAAIVQAALGLKDVQAGWSSINAACQILRRAGFIIVDKDGMATLGRDRPSTLLTQLQAMLKKIKKSERRAVVKQRIGQRILKKALVERCQGRCEISGVTDKKLLRASHIVAWRNGTVEEQLDLDNVVLLSALWDAAFDNGLISFSSAGEALYSNQLSPLAKANLSHGREKALIMNEQRRAYMARHRNEHGFPNLDH